MSHLDRVRTCPLCGNPYRGYPATSRLDNSTEICPECGTREALTAAGMPIEEQERVMREAAKGVYEPGFAPVPTPENTVKIDVDVAMEQLKKPEVRERIRRMLDGKDDEEEDS